MNFKWSKSLTDPAEIENCAGEGFDQIELSAVTLEQLKVSEVSELKDKIAAAGLMNDVCTAILPDEVRVTEQGFNIYAWTEYLKKLFEKTSAAGCRYALWNNPRARILPMEGEIGTFKEQALQFLFVLSETGEEFGTEILIEPHPEEWTNYINTFDEAREVITRVGRSNISVSLGFAGIDSIWPEGSRSSSEGIGYFHFENPDVTRRMRTAPENGDGIDYRAILSDLGSVGYSGIINLPSDADSDTLAYLKGLVS